MARNAINIAMIASIKHDLCMFLEFLMMLWIIKVDL
jgi:hypothetical protein